MRTRNTVNAKSAQIAALELQSSKVKDQEEIAKEISAELEASNREIDELRAQLKAQTDRAQSYAAAAPRV